MLGWDEPLAEGEAGHEAAEFGTVADLIQFEAICMLVILHLQINLIMLMRPHKLQRPVIVFHELLENFFRGVFPTNLFLLIPMGQKPLQYK